MLNTKLRISQNNPICVAEEKQPTLKKQQRLRLEQSRFPLFEQNTLELL